MLKYGLYYFPIMINLKLPLVLHSNIFFTLYIDRVGTGLACLARLARIVFFFYILKLLTSNINLKHKNMLKIK